MSKIRFDVETDTEAYHEPAFVLLVTRNVLNGNVKQYAVTVLAKDGDLVKGASGNFLNLREVEEIGEDTALNALMLDAAKVIRAQA